MTLNSTFSFVTDTATLAIFDPVRLQHRLTDSADWWSLPANELSEINRGNLFSVSTGSDGQYEVELHSVRAASASPMVEAFIACDSGRIFIGAGEEIPGEGLMPEAIRGGIFYNAVPGTYRVSVSRLGSWSLRVSLEYVESPAENTFHASPRLNECA